MRRECHPLLRGGRGENKYRHGFSVAEMESLASICEVVLPPLPINDHHKIIKEDQADHGEPNEDVESFWNISASRYPIPHEVQIYIYNVIFDNRFFFRQCFSALFPLCLLWSARSYEQLGCTSGTRLGSMYSTNPGR